MVALQTLNHRYYLTVDRTEDTCALETWSQFNGLALYRNVLIFTFALLTIWFLDSLSQITKILATVLVGVDGSSGGIAALHSHCVSELRLG